LGRAGGDVGTSAAGGAHTGDNNVRRSYFFDHAEFMDAEYFLELLTNYIVTIKNL
jgi:hypothetical protein